MKKLVSVLLAMLMMLLPVTAFADAGTTHGMVISFSSPMEGMEWLQDLFLLEEDGEGEDGTSYFDIAADFAQDELFSFSVASEGEDAPFYVRSNAFGDAWYHFTAEEAGQFVVRFAQKLADMGILPQEMLDEILSADADGDGLPAASDVLGKIDIDPMPIVEAFMQLVSNAEFTTEESEDEEVVYVTYGTIGKEDIWNLISALLEAARQIPEAAPVEVEISEEDLEGMHQAFLNALDGDIYIELGMSEEDFPVYAWVEAAIVNGEGVATAYDLYFESIADEEEVSYDLYLMTGDPEDEESLTSLAYATLSLADDGAFAALYIGDPAASATSITLTVEPKTDTEDGTMRNIVFAVTGIEENSEFEIFSLQMTNESYDDGFDFTGTVSFLGDELGTVYAVRGAEDSYVPMEHDDAVCPMDLDDAQFEDFCYDLLNSVMSFAESIIAKFVPAEV